MRRKALLIFSLAFLLMAAAVYGIGVLYFEEHFFPGTRINDFRCGFMTWQEAEKLLRKEAHAYALAVDTMNNGREAIYADDIELDYLSDGSVERFLKSQDRLLWFLYLNDPPSLQLDSSLQYNQKLLDEKVDTLHCMLPENTVYPEDASIVDRNGTYVISPEAEGTALDKSKVLEALRTAILGGYPEVNLVEQGCYLRPRKYQDDPDVIANCELMNQLKDVFITYDFVDDKVVVDWNRVQGFLSEDDEGFLSLDREKVFAFVADMAARFDTVGTFRPFVTYSGRKIEVGGGDFGWVIDQEAETDALIEDITNVAIKVREPLYQDGYHDRTANDIGSTYLEVDLAAQRMVYYNNGIPDVDTPIVSGAPTDATRTPTGVFSIQDKQSQVILQKDGMGASVDFWMTFDGDIGFHDSTWRVDYGGDIYMLDGTIGCIHVPYDAMAAIFSMVEIGTPVIIYN